MDFKEFYYSRHGLNKWGYPGETTDVVMSRVFDTAAEWLDHELRERIRARLWEFVNNVGAG